MAWLGSVLSQLLGLRRRGSAYLPRASSFQHVLRYFHKPEVEILEDRCLLANDLTAVGPAPEHVPATFSSSGVSSDQNVAGLVSAIAFGADSHGTGALYLGTAGGGVWVSTNYQSNNPTWKPLTDMLPGANAVDPTDGRGAGSINVGSIAVDPNHPQRIYVGTGFWRENYGSGILQSTAGRAGAMR
jgi:hypothetical protein